MTKTMYKAAALALATSAAFTLLSANALAQANEIKIGVSLSTTGPGASLGIPEKQALAMLPQTLGGKPVKYIMLDDGTDPSNASKNARRLIEEEKVDAIIGSSTVPTAIAVATVAAEGKTPAVALSPFVPKPGWLAWSFSLPQPVGVMSAALFDDMAARKVQSLAFIGYNDSYGEAWLKEVQPRAEASGIKLVATERFARTDQSVAGQTVKVVSSRPDAVIVVGSGTPAALPMTALRDRGYKGPIYQTHGVANNDFLRVGGKSADGVVLPAGALLVAEQLPEGHPSKAVASDFVKRYEAKYGAGSRDLFAGYAYDAYLLLGKAAASVPTSVQPGTPAFRQALRDAIENTKGLPATHGVISVSKTEHSVYDASSRVLVKVQNGSWRIEK
ncbi:ABC transporter substrate-binding protein [Cupriavidus consociatus]|uniref:ABC transporter substrate-binding protein n=1 Tax=Cupriavidus consociatus TaxID=2821357 RepID=UPI001AE7BB3C|nr:MULTISPECIES: ABC transporter substrate-binding protein [unclassified Cupriavidus]MBP0620823.1 ABC transporter substrate-binding protein [Cupriavidus sp. LEh25]MDK2657483.1 ABC transporter substrate-binding protein [Cupriavidus sp. LEh21]